MIFFQRLKLKDYVKSILISLFLNVFFILPLWFKLNYVDMLKNGDSEESRQVWFYISTTFSMLVFIFTLVLILAYISRTRKFSTVSDSTIDLEELEFELKKVGTFIKNKNKYYFTLSQYTFLDSKESVEIEINTNEKQIIILASRGMRNLINRQTKLKI